MVHHILKSNYPDHLVFSVEIIIMHYDKTTWATMKSSTWRHAILLLVVFAFIVVVGVNMASFLLPLPHTTYIHGSKEKQYGMESGKNIRFFSYSGDDEHTNDDDHHGHVKRDVIVVHFWAS